jgi:ribosomal protein L11 methyltransferase
VIDFVLEIVAGAALEDEVQSRLFLTDSSGNSSSEKDGIVTISAFFDTADQRDEAITMLRGIDARVRAEDRPHVDWLERYEQSLEPLFIGRSFVVAPDSSLVRGSERLRIIVPQEQAFGTGSHETTSLCLEMLERLEIKDKRGLDIGSGSGILAIAMHRLGAQKVIAFDHDLDAFGPLRDNRMRNGVPDSTMPIFIGGIESLRGGTFDVATMNIVPEVIVAMLGQVRARLLILSGILVTRRDEVISAASGHGLALDAEAAKGDWWAGMFASG